jgi:hypothetical protein
MEGVTDGQPMFDPDALQWPLADDLNVTLTAINLSFEIDLTFDTALLYSTWDPVTWQWVDGDQVDPG